MIGYHSELFAGFQLVSKFINSVLLINSENMWDCHTFQAYLRQIGKFEMWNDKIYPGKFYSSI